MGGRRRDGRGDWLRLRRWRDGIDCWCRGERQSCRRSLFGTAGSSSDSRQIQFLQKVVGGGKNFVVLEVFVGERAGLRAKSTFGIRISGRISLALETAQFFKIVASGLASLSLKIALHRVANLNQSHFAGVGRQRFFHARECGF